MRVITVIFLLPLLCSCTKTPPLPPVPPQAENPDADEFEMQDPFAAQDPFEPVNQKIFGFNLAADKAVIKPVARAYGHLPEYLRSAIGNFLSNLNEPVYAVNGILQLDAKIAFTSFWRFGLNSTFGFAGLRDFAGENGLKRQSTNFGKTLGSYGVVNGAYIVLPLAGPSSVRGTVGTVVDWVINPVGFIITTPESIADYSANAIVTRNTNAPTIDHFYYDTIDPYSAARAAYLQNQAFQ